MRTALLLGSALALLGGAALAQDNTPADTTYGQLSLGAGFAGHSDLSVQNLTTVHTNRNAGIFAAGALGKQMGHFSLEGEILYLHNDLKTGGLNLSNLGDQITLNDDNASTRTIGGVVNAKYTFTGLGPFSFDVGGGAGYGNTRYDVLGASDSKSGLLWQAIAGVNYPLSNTWSLGLQYRYIDSPDVKNSVALAGTPYDYKIETRTHVFAVDLKRPF